MSILHITREDLHATARAKDFADIELSDLRGSTLQATQYVDAVVLTEEGKDSRTLKGETQHGDNFNPDYLDRKEDKTSDETAEAGEGEVA